MFKIIAEASKRRQNTVFGERPAVVVKNRKN